jgi:hypothetical protein
MFEQMTKYFVVSNALPGPMTRSHHPGLRSCGVWYPAMWASPERAWTMRTALSRWGDRVPYVSYASVMGPSFWPHSSSISFGGSANVT